MQVVASIHQPSGDITQLFDDFLLLSLGRLMYCGDWQHANGFFEALGYQCALNGHIFVLAGLAGQQCVVQVYVSAIACVLGPCRPASDVLTSCMQSQYAFYC